LGFEPRSSERKAQELPLITDADHYELILLLFNFKGLKINLLTFLFASASKQVIVHCNFTVLLPTRSLFCTVNNREPAPTQTCSITVSALAAARDSHSNCKPV